MKDGVIFKTREQFALFGLMTFMTQYNYHFKTTPRNYKVHRSLHPYILFGISIYLPYRYSATIDTVLFTLSRSSNPYINLLIRLPSKLIIYGLSIFTG